MKLGKTKEYTNKRIGKSLEIAELDEKYLLKSSALKYYPLVVERAENSKVWDVDGNEFIDFLSSAAVYNIGHSNQKVIKAIKDQMEKSLNYIRAYFYTEPPVKLAKLLTRITPGEFTKKVFFGFSGSDAVDLAIKVSRACSKKQNMISFYGSYHGTTYGALSATGIIDKKIKNVVFPLKGFRFFQYADCYRCPFHLSYPGCGLECLDHIRKEIEKENTNTGAIIFEPIQGDCGIIVPPKDFIKGLSEIAKENDLILVDEEVQSGMGRTGKLWAIEHYDVVPDLLISAKALGGGMPISAVIGRAHVMNSLPTPLSVFTHGGHAVSASSALATIDFTINEKLPERAKELGNHAIKRLNELKEKYKMIGDVRGKGLLIGLDIIKKGKAPDKKTALKIGYKSWEKGLILITFGKHGNILRIAPPLTIPKEELDKGMDIIEESIKDVSEGKVKDGAIESLNAWG